MRPYTLAALLASTPATMGYVFNICAKGGGCTTIDGPDDDVLTAFPDGYRENLRSLQIMEMSDGCVFFTVKCGVHELSTVGETLDEETIGNCIGKVHQFHCWPMRDGWEGNGEPAATPTRTAG
ncbi:hypothetical protein MGN70_004224 [Eutypa lata]|nr:hypothetical protein MGN70_004224 [Eutypa lata]